MSARRLVTWLAVALGVLAVLVAGAVLVSAVVDEPSKTVSASVRIEAPKRDVWRTLTDLAAYGDWNPSIVSAEGALEKGATLELRVRDGDGTESREVEVLDVKPARKLRWQDRLLAPGVRDRELTLRLFPVVGAKHTLVSALERYEGLLVPLSGTGDEQARLKRMLEALKARVEAS